MPARGKASICCRSIAHSPLEASCRSPQGGAPLRKLVVMPMELHSRLSAAINAKRARTIESRTVGAKDST